MKNLFFWKEVIKDEMDSLIKNKAWILVNRPSNQKIVYGEWVYKIKEAESTN